MKKKVTAYSLLGLFFVYACCHVLWFSKTTPQDLSAVGVLNNKRIVAPATIDSLSDLTRIPALQSGVVKTIYVHVGQQIKQGQPLFSLDSTLIENEVIRQKIRYIEARNAWVNQQKHLKHLNGQLKRLERVDKRAISRVDLQEKKHEVMMGQAQLTQAKQEMALAKANLTQAELTQKQFNVAAPKDSIVLQINAHVSEFVGTAQPVILLGDAEKIMVRVALDERDTQQFDPKASAYLTSNDDSTIKIPLTFVQLDRYLVMHERLNARVQEAIYYVNRKSYPDIVAGQQFDANISVRSKT